MRRRTMITFIFVNVLVSLGVAFGVISALGSQQQTTQQVVITVPVVYTPTIGPTQTPFVITATLADDVALLPTGIVDGAAPGATAEPGANANAAAVATLDPEIVSADANLQGTATALPENCIIHTVKEGDTPFAIAEEYGIDGFQLMELNALDDISATQLQIGDVLIVPLEGCALAPLEAPVSVAAAAAADPAADTAAAEVTEAVTAEATEAAPATPTPTLTLPPTAVTAQMEILQVISPGDVTAEGVEIRNNGDTVNISGWTLSDDDGNTFEFPEQLLFSESLVMVYTGTGATTPIEIYWGLDESVWEAGDTITLTDEDGTIQSTYRVPTGVNLE